ncbi:tRNA uridine-5-carboxymethylaminomethyl(34) synthesis enzyme MnmG [Myxococcota bacterium]
MTRQRYEVIVVGAGHAGCEAALAAARLGLSTALVTIRQDSVAAMSCNPAIGGLGKSQIVREVDALGGEMARAADAAAIHFRRLNRSKGPAVRARRVQCDMGRYHAHMLEAVAGTGNLHLIEGMVDRVLTENGAAAGVELSDGTRLSSPAVVLTTGTFLRGKMHVGMESTRGGRLGDPPAESLTGSLESLGLKTGRLKTGTPARLRAGTVDFAGLEAQLSDVEVLAFAHGGSVHVDPQIRCYITRTNPRTHEIIRSALDRSPLYTGVIEGRGPRYCPSIEDKVVRFPDRSGHQVILEPTDLSTGVIYPNGISTSLPKDIQEEIVHSIEGLERAEIVDYGYAVEYDFVMPTQLDRTLQTRRVSGLFLAGQINGTSGYEEAAGQGLLAGINAAAALTGRDPLILGRSEAYIGVMVDDLVTRGTSEPYRMFSSRAEFRLMLREDNAVGRLAGRAEAVGLVPGDALSRRRAEQKLLQDLIEDLQGKRHEKDQEGRRPTLEKVLRRPEVGIEELSNWLSGDYPKDVLEQAEVQVKYAGYIERQVRQARQLEKMEGKKIPKGIQYVGVPGLSRELAEKLDRTQPSTLGQASRIDGMTPAALMVISIWIKKSENVPRGTFERDSS